MEDYPYPDSTDEKKIPDKFFGISSMVPGKLIPFVASDGKIKGVIDLARGAIAGLNYLSIKEKIYAKNVSVRNMVKAENLEANNLVIKAKNFNQYISEINEKLKTLFDKSEQKAAGKFELNRDTINVGSGTFEHEELGRGGYWEREILNVGGKCYIRFWLKITELHHNGHDWVKQRTEAIGFDMVSNPYIQGGEEDSRWARWNEREGELDWIKIEDRRKYRICNPLVSLKRYAFIKISPSSLKIRLEWFTQNEDEDGRDIRRVREGKAKFVFNWHCMG